MCSEVRDMQPHLAPRFSNHMPQRVAKLSADQICLEYLAYTHYIYDHIVQAN